MFSPRPFSKVEVWKKVVKNFHTIVKKLFESVHDKIWPIKLYHDDNEFYSFSNVFILRYFLKISDWNHEILITKFHLF